MNDQVIAAGFLTRFGATYSCGSYGAGAYNESATCGSSTTTGGLAGTGENIAVGLGGGVLLIVVAVVIFIRMHRKKNK